MSGEPSAPRGAVIHVQQAPAAAQVLEGHAHVVISLQRDGRFSVHAYHDGQQHSAAHWGEPALRGRLVQEALQEADAFLGFSRGAAR